MKNKLIRGIMILSTMALIYMPATVDAAPIESNCAETSSTETSINARAATKEWKYKTINGKLYRRLWNNQTDKWETDWILVG